MYVDFTLKSDYFIISPEPLFIIPKGKSLPSCLCQALCADCGYSGMWFLCHYHCVFFLIA